MLVLTVRVDAAVVHLRDRQHTVLAVRHFPNILVIDDQVGLLAVAQSHLERRL